MFYSLHASEPSGVSARIVSPPLRISLATRMASLSSSGFRGHSSAASCMCLTYSRRRFVLLLLGFFAVMALGLSAIGLYGVMTEVVTRRVKEIGIRVAVGASPGEIMRLILRRGLGLSIAGVALGSAGALAASYLVASQLYGVSTHDLSTLSITGVASSTSSR